MLFKFEYEDQNDEWIDTTFSDNSPKSDRRTWRLSCNTMTGERYAMLGRAEDGEAPFGHWVKLPRKMMAVLLKSL